MNHLRTYIRLMRKAKTREFAEGYTEKHHVFPRCLFGENSRVVTLTAREHFIAHSLLLHLAVRRYGEKHWKTVKLALALQAMSMSSKFTNSREIKTSRNFQKAREVYSAGVSGENHWTVVQNRENPLVELNRDPEIAKRRGERNSRLLREKAERGEHVFQDEEWLRQRNEDPAFINSCAEGGKAGKGKHWYRNTLTGEQTKAFELPDGKGWEPGRLSFTHRKNR